MPDNILAEVPYDLLEDFNPDKQKKDKMDKKLKHFISKESRYHEEAYE